ncbi:SRPBCC domain-containing protein [Tropicibacter sp. R15_0]|uniref:SRPBCC family protein n=1 Tax=Tropicibacter sp. R15_0 TaxID=2821101 RepID=UPI001AD9B934|nr:SRPBCC domain-containing protein [Tropicibacter sp. R15_0]MBO9465108.1 SRPBCC domain-containing protein [Tropicibacter sp. R15_0]
MTLTIRKTVFLPAAPAIVWNHLTKADLMGKWFHPAAEDLAEGQPYTLLSAADGERMCWGEVEKATPHEHMRWSFTVGPMQGVMSTVDWRLAPAPGGTELTLEHSGLPENGEGYGLVLALDKGWHGFLGNFHAMGNDYTATIRTPASVETAQKAIFDEMHIWWSTRVEKTASGATIHFGNSHVSFDFAKRDGTYVWTCREANMIIEDVADATEWQGTSLIWQILPDGDGSRITLSHLGLTPSLDCHDVCTRGWQKYFENSLLAHLSGETATPETREPLSV